ncbi:Rdx family protein [Haladaptatus sp. NG-WS-4]
MLDRTQSLQRELLSEYGRRLDAVTLKTGDDGVFRVSVDDEVVFDKKTDEYDIDAIAASVGERL